MIKVKETQKCPLNIFVSSSMWPEQGFMTVVDGGRFHAILQILVLYPVGQ